MGQYSVNILKESYNNLMIERERIIEVIESDGGVAEIVNQMALRRLDEKRKELLSDINALRARIKRSKYKKSTIEEQRRLDAGGKI